MKTEQTPYEGPVVIEGAAAVIRNPVNSSECVVVKADPRFDESRIAIGIFARCSDGEWRGVRGRGLSFPRSLVPRLIEGLAATVPVS